MTCACRGSTRTDVCRQGDDAEEPPEELGLERAYLVQPLCLSCHCCWMLGWLAKYAFALAIQAGVQIKRQGSRNRFALSITDSLEELRRLANTAGLQVIGQTFQALEAPHPVRPAPLLACPAVSLLNVKA